MSDRLRGVLVEVEDVLADELARLDAEAAQSAAFGQRDHAVAIERETDDGGAVDDLAQARLGGAQRIGRVARVGHVDHDAEHLALRRDEVHLRAEPALVPVGGDHAMTERALFAVGGDGVQEREELLAIVGMEPLDQELRVAGAVGGRIAETRQGGAGGEGHLQGSRVGLEDDRVEAAEGVVRRRRRLTARRPPQRVRSSVRRPRAALRARTA